MNIYGTWRKSNHSAPENECIELAWRKSSFSAPENACVEVSAAAIRDSKNPDGPRLHVTNLSALLDRVKAGLPR